MFFEVSAKCTLPLPRDLLITAARQRARGVSWEVIAKEAACSEGELLTFSIDHPEIWGPLYARAEKLRLQETEGQGLAHLTALLKGEDETAAEKAGRELLIHRRHVERRRYGGRNCRLPERHLVCPTGGESLDETTPGGRNLTICQGGQKESFEDIWPIQDPPADLIRRIMYAAHRVAHGEDYASIGREVGHDAEAVARWAFAYAKTWDRVYPQARLAAAQFTAALAINRLLDLAAGPDANLAARAARTLLIHRRHMHWGNQPQARVPEGGGEYAGTYPPSVAQVSVAIGGNGSLTVARRSGPARSSGAVRPSADASSAPSAVKRSLPRARDGPR